MDPFFDLELSEFRNNNFNLDLSGLANISNLPLPSMSLTGLSDLNDEEQQSQREEIKNLSSKVQCLEQQLNQFVKTVSYCFDMVNQFQAMNTKFQAHEKLLHATVSDVTTLKRLSLWRNHIDTPHLEESFNTVAPDNGPTNTHELDQEGVENTRPDSGCDQAHDTKTGSNVLDTPAMESINIGDADKIPDEPEAAAVPNSEDSENKLQRVNDQGENAHNEKVTDGLDSVGVGNFDYDDYELISTVDDDLDHHSLNSMNGHETKEIHIDDIDFDVMGSGDQNHFYSTIALDELFKFGLRPHNKGTVKENNSFNPDLNKLSNGSSQIDFDDDDDNDEPEKVDPCSVCGKVLSRSKDMRRHMLTHTEKTQKAGFPCPDCGKYFARKDAIKKHQKQNQCSKLDQVRYQTELLEGRRKVATVENSTPECPVPSTCEVCGKVFGSKTRMKEHYRLVHDMIKNFRCPKCEKTFYRKVNLKAHLKKHDKDAAYRCETCDRVFARVFDLARHKKSHVGIKEFKCDVCGAGFSRGYGLAKHRRLHEAGSDERNHNCDQCGAAFKEIRTLTKHKNQYHQKGSGSSNDNSNGGDELENQGRQQLSELKNIISNGEQSSISYEFFDSVISDPLDNPFEGASFR